MYIYILKSVYFIIQASFIKDDGKLYLLFLIFFFYPN